MPLETLDSRSPSLFNRGPSLLARMGLAGALAVFLMVADSRFHIGDSARRVIATGLVPLQWISARPVRTFDLLGDYVTTVGSAQQTREQAAVRLSQQSLKAQRAESLERENTQLRELLKLQQSMPLQARAAEVVYIAPDPFTRKVIINKGSSQGVVAGSAVIDESGLLGQVARVFPLSSEVSMIDNPEQATPVINSRTGERALVYGDSQSPNTSALEVRFMANNADYRVGDTLVTSGVGGMYPAGLPVASVAVIGQRSASAFARIQATPIAHPMALGYVLVLDPPPPVQADAPVADTRPAAPGKAGRKGAKGVRP